jgi:hypothetical protein
MKKLELIINLSLAIFMFFAGAIILFLSIKWNFTGMRFAFSIAIFFLLELLAGLIINDIIFHNKNNKQ